MIDFATQRRLMVERQLRARGIRDPHVLAAMATVPREAFVRAEHLALSYQDAPLPIEAEQTISQPYIVALMIQALALRGDETVLDVGTGSGYAAAVLASIARRVYSIERIPELAGLARARLARLAYPTIEVACGDGTLGWPEHAPYDAIAVAASGPDVPYALLEQLAVGGRLVMPIGLGRIQQLVRVTRVGEHTFRDEDLGAVQFVPLIGEHGWPDDTRNLAS